MRKISELYDHIKEEIEDAEEYIRDALRCKENDRDIADTYCTLAEEELKHAEALHKQVVRVIEAYRKTNGDPPPDMQARYDILHEMHIADVNKIRLMVRIYKE